MRSWDSVRPPKIEAAQSPDNRNASMNAGRIARRFVGLEGP
jgi:hypothetical protein